MSSSIAPGGAPPVQSAKVHIIDHDGSSTKAQMRIRLSSALSFVDLCHLAEQRYFKMTGCSFAVRAVQDADGNEFSLDDPVDQLDRDEVAYIIIAPPAIGVLSDDSSMLHVRRERLADLKHNPQDAGNDNDSTLSGVQDGLPAYQIPSTRLASPVYQPISANEGKKSHPVPTDTLQPRIEISIPDADREDQKRAQNKAAPNRGIYGTALPPGPAQRPDDLTTPISSVDDRDGLQGLLGLDQELEELTGSPRRDVYDIPTSDDSDVPRLKRTTPLRVSKKPRRQVMRRSSPSAARSVNIGTPKHLDNLSEVLEAYTRHSTSISPKNESSMGLTPGRDEGLSPTAGGRSDRWLDFRTREPADSAAHHSVNTDTAASARSDDQDAAPQLAGDTKPVKNRRLAIKREEESGHEIHLEARPMGNVVEREHKVEDEEERKRLAEEQPQPVKEEQSVHEGEMGSVRDKARQERRKRKEERRRARAERRRLKAEQKIATWQHNGTEQTQGDRRASPLDMHIQSVNPRTTALQAQATSGLDYVEADIARGILAKSTNATESSPPRPKASGTMGVEGGASLGKADTYQDPNAGKTTPEMQPTYRGPWPRSRLGEHKIFTPAHHRDFEFLANDGRPKLGPGPTDDEVYVLLDPNEEIPAMDLEISISARPLRVDTARKASKRGHEHIESSGDAVEDQARPAVAFSDPQAVDKVDLPDSREQYSPAAAGHRHSRLKRARLRSPARQVTGGNRPRSAHDYEDDDSRVRYWLKEADRRAEASAREAAEARRAAWASEASLPARAVSQPSMPVFSRAEAYADLSALARERPEDFYIFPSESESEGESTRAFLAKIRSPSPDADLGSNDDFIPRGPTVGAKKAPKGGSGDFKPVDNLEPERISRSRSSIAFDEDNFFQTQAALRNRSRSSRKTPYPRGATPAPNELADQQPQREEQTLEIQEKGYATGMSHDDEADTPRLATLPSGSKKKRHGYKRSFRAKLRRKHLGR